MIYLCLTDVEKMDCCFLQQSIDSISKDISAYIENTRNQKQKNERICAYSSLFFALSEIFDEKECDIKFSVDGKPYLIGTKKKIYVNLSHTDTLCAVCLSDEGDVGIDLQDEINTVCADRLSKRFFSDIIFQSEHKNKNMTPLNYHMFVIESENGKLRLNANIENSIHLIKNTGDFTEKWSLGESILKCHGTGFKNASIIGEMQKKCDCTTLRFNTKNKEFALSISIKRL